MGAPVYFPVLKLSVAEESQLACFNKHVYTLVTNIFTCSEKIHIHFSFYLANYYFGCVDHNKLWKILQDMGIPDHLTCLLRNLYAG